MINTLLGQSALLALLATLLTGATALTLHADDAASSAAEGAFFKSPIYLGAHRGGSAEAPESTLAAFRAAAASWPDILLETDSRLTADDHVVLLHDATVDRTTDGTGAVAEMTLAQLRELDAGYRFTPDQGTTYPFRGKGHRIATLAEVLAALPDSRFEIELKEEGPLAERVVEVLRQQQATDRVLLASSHAAAMARVRELAPEIPLCYDMTEGLKMMSALRSEDPAVWEAYEPTAEVLAAFRRMIKQFSITREDVLALQAKGIRVQVHTVNKSAEMRDLLALGIDSILTDRPSLLARILAEDPKSAPD